MSLGVVGQKRGMTRIFTEDGESVPVTVIEVRPNRVMRLKTQVKDGYDAVQITTGERHANRINKAEAGEYAAANVAAGRGLWEFRLDGSEHHELEAGSEIKVELFEDGQKVDVIGTTIGKGFAGVVKRYHFKMQDATHGNSLAHRAPGSIGQCQTPGRVFKGKRMAGQMGNKRRTATGLTIVRVDGERNLLLIKGAVPGAKGGDVIVRPSIKARKTGE